MNGTNSRVIRTLHGRYELVNQRYKSKEGFCSDFLSDYGGGESKGLREFLSYYSLRLSYREVEGLAERMMGVPIYGHRQIANKVLKESEKVKQASQGCYSGMQLSICFVESVDIYDPLSKELLYFDDGIGVKKQKLHRQKQEESQEKESKTVQTDVIVIGTCAADFHHLTSGEVKNSLEETIHCYLSYQYGTQTLPIVAITDGAKCIRNRLVSLFGEGVQVILDWYHLEDKIRKYLSRLGLNKTLKEEHIQEMLGYLWHGKPIEALIYADVMIQTKHLQILEELQNYILKHQSEICNYEKRQKVAGKTIGSGRGEKANDIIVARRQKKKSQAWSKKGSNALSVLKTVETNGLWKLYWEVAA